MKNRLLRYCSVFCFFLSGISLSGIDLNRFLPEKKESKIAPAISLPVFPSSAQAQVDPETHNKGVSLNNDGLKAMKNKDYEKAIKCFSKAVDHNPSEPAFLNNLALVLHKTKKKPERALEVCKMILSIDNKSFPAAFTAGLILFEQLDKPLEAISFFELASKLRPDDVQVLSSLASAWEKLGYSDQAIQVLNSAVQYSKGDPYPAYMLGLMYLEKKDFASAIKVLQPAAQDDKEGYVRETLARALYFAGELNGLAEFCSETARNYYNLPNRKSLERILHSLKPHKLRFTETINIELSDPRSINDLSMLVRPVPTVPEHQTVTLESAEWLSKGRSYSVVPSAPDSDGRVKFAAQNEAVGSKLSLKLTYRIHIKPSINSTNSIFSSNSPDITEFLSNPKFELDNTDLKQLADALSANPVNLLQTFYSAVGKGLSYQENCEEKSLSWIFKNPDVCDCTEYSLLFAALAISRGIPARIATGFLLKQEISGRETNIGHAWVEAYTPGKGWIPIDPTLGQNLHWAYFGNLLSDQLLFDIQESGRKNRITANVTANTANVDIKISSSFCYNILKN
ncbi:MAG: tetratricopeptide repeat protein [Candidatus Riflebacteria bacterium]|nr:tetratricopeptide repeat protein [Candidatus Riflebacteria bacterium]